MFIGVGLHWIEAKENNLQENCNNVTINTCYVSLSYLEVVPTVDG